MKKRAKMLKVKQPENLTVEEVNQLVNDTHALMWYGDGCEICAHKIVDKRAPYKKLSCDLGGLAYCKPIWQGLVIEEKEEQSERIV